MAANPDPTIESRNTVHPRWLRPLLLVASTCALAAIAAACSDEAGDPEEGLPITPTRCAIYWARENFFDDPASLDIFVVDQPLAAWTTGTGSYGGVGLNIREGLFLHRTPDGSLTAALSVGKTTSGEFQLTVQGTATGDTVSFVDGTAQLLVDARTETSPPMVGTGGQGSFSGVWSDPAADTSAEIDWASGATLTVTYLGSSFTLGGSELGGMSAYAQCYDANAIRAAGATSPFQTLFGSGTRYGKGSR